MFKRIKKRKERKEFNLEVDLAIGVVLERFGQANAEHFKAYSELKKISAYIINPEFSDNNYKQQAGKSAEVKEKTRTNASSILKGDSKRIEQTDKLGDVNHKKYDLVEVDEKRNPIKNEKGEYLKGYQQKTFYKIKNYDKLYGKEFEHYKDTKIIVPSNFYDKINKRWEDKISSLKRQEETLIANGEKSNASIKRKQINKIEDTKKRLVKAKVSTKAAMEARKNPKLSTAKDITKIANKAGLEAAKMSAVIGVGMNGVTNAIAVINGEKSIEDASLDVLKDTGKATAESYATAATASVIGGVLESSSKQILNNLAKKNGPAAIVSTGVILSKQVYLLASGEITAEQFAKNIGQEGATLAASMTGSNLGAVLGTAIFPGIGTVIGGIVGGMFASMMSGAMYNELTQTLQDTRISEEKRRYIHAYCEQLKEEEIKYRQDMIEVFNYFFDEKENELRIGFNSIANSIMSGQSIHEGLETIGSAFNLKLAFSSPDDFKTHIKSGGTLKF